MNYVELNLSVFQRQEHEIVWTCVKQGSRMRSAKDAKDGAAVQEEKRKTAVQIPVVKEDVQ